MNKPFSGPSTPQQESRRAELIINISPRHVKPFLKSIELLCGSYGDCVDLTLASDKLSAALCSGKLEFKRAINIIDVLGGIPFSTKIGVPGAHTPDISYFAAKFREFVSLVENGKIYEGLSAEERKELIERVPGWRNLH